MLLQLLYVKLITQQTNTAVNNKIFLYIVIYMFLILLELHRMLPFKPLFLFSTLYGENDRIIT